MPCSGVIAYRRHHPSSPYIHLLSELLPQSGLYICTFDLCRCLDVTGYQISVSKPSVCQILRLLMDSGRVDLLAALPSISSAVLQCCLLASFSKGVQILDNQDQAGAMGRPWWACAHACLIESLSFSAICQAVWLNVAGSVEFQAKSDSTRPESDMASQNSMPSE